MVLANRGHENEAQGSTMCQQSNALHQEIQKHNKMLQEEKLLSSTFAAMKVDKQPMSQQNDALHRQTQEPNRQLQNKNKAMD